MSGLPDKEAGGDSAEGIILYLNKKAGKKFQAVDSSLKFIRARMREGRTPEEIRAVIDDRVAAWSGDEKMQEYLRPGTLFNAEKFNDYFGNLGAAPAEDQWRNGLKIA